MNVVAYNDSPYPQLKTVIVQFLVMNHHTNVKETHATFDIEALHPQPLSLTTFTYFMLPIDHSNKRSLHINPPFPAIFLMKDTSPYILLDHHVSNTSWDNRLVY